MSDVINVLLEQAGGPAGIVILALSLATNIIQAIKKAKAAKAAAQVREAAGAIIRGVETFAPETAAPVKQEIKAESIISGVLGLVQTLVDEETKK